MNDSRFPVLLYFLMLAFGLLHWAHVYPRLPERMASHFTATGAPNGWQPKQAFFLLSSVVVGMSAFVAFLAPRFITSRPAEKINLPHKEYWLAPKRRKDTLRFFRAKMAWFGCGLLFVLLYGTSQAINANLPNVGYFDAKGMWYVAAGFLFFTLVWIIRFLRHFYSGPTSHSPSPPGPLQK
jgi:uncharacterized membrane protein